MLLRTAAALLLLSATAARAQTLFIYGPHAISKAEFYRVYTKNSLAKKPDLSDTALRSYLDLYSLFRMKVREAETMKLDTSLAIQRELDNYRRQLAQTYLTDDPTTGRLTREAYDRMKEEVRVAHILIPIQPNAPAADTQARFRTADSLYRAITSGKADFAATARAISGDPGSQASGGDIGYLTALQTVYPFENAAYATKKGTVSKPFRTAYGYHIVKVLDRRPSRGEVTVRQIMAASPVSKGEEGLVGARRKMDSVQAALRGGMPFEEAARRFSEDRFTSDKGGLLDPFGVGRMTPDFEAAAFGLKKPGDRLATPVRTDYGLHLIQLVSRTALKPYDSLQASLKRRVEADSRAQIARDANLEASKKRYGFSEDAAAYAEVEARVLAITDTGRLAGVYTATDFARFTRPLFKLGTNAYTGADFIKFAEGLTRGRFVGARAPILRDLYRVYTTRVVTDYTEQRLAQDNPEFQTLMAEYRDGILLFDLMERMVWNKASQDTAGLDAFFARNSAKYQWQPGFKGYVVRFSSDSLHRSVMAKLGKGGNPDAMLDSLVATEGVTLQRGRYEWNRFTDVPRASVAAKGFGAPQRAADGSTTVVYTQETFSTVQPKTLADARGYAVSEYQDYLEAQWNADLRQKYPVKVDEAVFRTMVKQ